MFVRDAAASQAPEVDAVANAYLKAVTTAGGAKWGALFAVEGETARLEAAYPEQPDTPLFATTLSSSLVCDVPTGEVPATLGSRLPAAVLSAGASSDDVWISSRIGFGGECLAGVILGFEDPERVPHGGVLADAHARLGAALHNARLYEAQARSARLSELLEDADVQMLAASTPQDVLAVTVRTLEDALGARDVTLSLPDDSTDTTRSARIGLELKGDLLEASFRVMERPGTLHLRIPSDIRPPGQADMDFVNRLLSTMALAVESQLLQQDRERLMRAREEWVADLSHDIRTPLASIRGYAELLATGTGIDEQEVRREAALIARQATTIERLVQDLHTAFRLRAGSLPVSLASVELGPIIAEALEVAVWHAGRGRSAVPFDAPEHPVFALVDPSRFSRIVTNLATNAFVHNPPQARVWASLTCDAERAHVTVADEGLGMDAATAERVRMRGERGAGQGAPGTGLGMAIVHELASDIGGRVRVDSAQGRGTTVTVSVQLDSDRTNGCA